MKYTMEKIKEKIRKWGSDLSQLEGIDRFQYLIEQAKLLEPLAEEYKIREFQIHGCASKLWLVPRIEHGRIHLQSDSDAFITKGTAAIILNIFSGELCTDVIKINTTNIAELGILEILTPQRQNGLSNLITTIQRYANKG
jgi:cysteine desulfuration protein SufE